MGKQIAWTVLWIVVLFVVSIVVKYFQGESEWLKDTLGLIGPFAVGYFLGYGQARSDGNR